MNIKFRMIFYDLLHENWPLENVLFFNFWEFLPLIVLCVCPAPAATCLLETFANYLNALSQWISALFSDKIYSNRADSLIPVGVQNFKVLTWNDPIQVLGVQPQSEVYEGKIPK